MFDLTQFKAMTVYLHLLIFSTDKMELFVQAPIAPIARTIHPSIGTLGERIAKEHLVRQYRLIPVTAGNLFPAEIKLPFHSGSNLLEIFIQNIGSYIADGTAYCRKVITTFGSNHRPSAKYCVFSGPVAIDQGE